nr:MAG TPA: hypothetical protein [Caudoviricetes sp.]
MRTLTNPFAARSLRSSSEALTICMIGYASTMPSSSAAIPRWK